MATSCISPRRRFLQHISTFLHILLYYFIYLLYRLQQAFIYTKRFLTNFFSSPQSPDRTPFHVAVSGPISSHIPKLCHLISALVSHGSMHISLYDPCQIIDAQLLSQYLQASALSAKVREVGHFGERQVSSSIPVTEPETNSETIVTIAHPGADRDVLVRATVKLAEEQGNRDLKQVYEWLDNEAEGMLPSEPDVLVVFPEEGKGAANVLNGFPIWQLRLTQIRFPEVSIGNMCEAEFLKMVASAASAPKRFGR